MDDFTRRLITEWRRLGLPFRGATFVAAVSGGADSVSLLLALGELRDRKKLALRFVVAHLDHGLRGEEGEKDAEFVRDLCVKFDFELALGKANVAREGNLEQNARAARYDFLTETAEKLSAYAVLTAHTVNDQAETFLINLLRGSGLRGLGGMKPVRNLKSQAPSFKSEELSGVTEKSQIANCKSQMLLVRPLLNWAHRRDTENFCHLKEVEFRYDTMNEDLAFKRVRIRKVLLPMLADFNPKIVETLANTANLLRQETENIGSVQGKSGEREDWPKENSAAAIELAKDQRSKIKDQSLPLKELKTLPKAALYRILREWLEANRGNLRLLELKHIEALERLIFSRKSGRVVELPDGETVVKESGKLVFRIKG